MALQSMSRRSRSAFPLSSFWRRRRAWALGSLSCGDRLGGHLQMSDVDMECLQDGLVFRVLLPSGLIIQDCW